MLPILDDLRHALRGLRQSPGVLVIGIASLALGVGANVTVYSVVREMILDDFSARQPDRLVRVGADVSDAGYRDLRQAAVFQDVAFETGLGDVSWRSGSRSEVAWRMTTSANFFDVLGVGASAGRLYSQRDEGRPVAVVSYGFWRKRLHSDRRAVGLGLALNGKLYTVLGVLPRDYRSILGHGVAPELYLIGEPGSRRRYHLFARLRDGLTRTQTQQAFAAAARVIGGPDFARRIARLRPMGGLVANAAATGDDRRFFLFFAMLFGTSAMLALIGCSNVSGLLLARNIARQRELAIRQALGANRLQVARQLFADAVVLVTLGACAGLLVDASLRHWLSDVHWPSAYNLPVEFHFPNDRGLLLYGVAAALVTLLLSSLVPALRGSKVDLGLAMKQGEPAFSIRRWNLRNTLVALHVVLSMVLLALGLLFFRSFSRVAGIDPGFDVSHTMVAQVHSFPGEHTGEKRWTWCDALVRRMREVPGVRGVTSVGTLPFMGELPQDALRRKGDPAAVAVDAYSMGAGEQFCQVLGIPILRGRDFQIGDRTREPMPALLNQALARRLFGDGDPVGARLVVGREKERVLEVVGVIADTRMRTLGEGHAPMFFTPYEDAQMLVRLAGNPGPWMRPLRDALAAVDATDAIEIRPLSEAAAGAIFPMRAAAGFLGGLSVLGLLLVLSGLYSSVSYATRRRTREMAIRAAVGATRATILWTAIRDGLAVLACGVAVGLPLAIAAIRPLTDILPDGVDPWNPVMFATVALVLLATGAGAAWIPARNAASVDPALAFRQE